MGRLRRQRGERREEWPEVLYGPDEWPDVIDVPTPSEGEIRLIDFNGRETLITPDKVWIAGELVWSRPTSDGTDEAADS